MNDRRRSATGRRGVGLALGVVLLASGCSTVHTARPLGKGRHAVHLSVGGPVAGIGEADMILPLATLTYKYGVTDRLDVFGGWHVMETFINDGNLFFDLGAAYYIADQKTWIPGISAAATMSPLINQHSGWVVFDLQLTASWYLDPSDTQLVYLGFHNLITPIRDRVLEAPLYTWSPYVGWQGKFLSWLAVGAEVKWHRPGQSTTESVVAYLAPGDQGALSFLLGFTFIFPQAQEGP